mgnify:CR=1 FL=1
METEKWGPGNATEAKAFDTVKVGEETVDLIFGQFPHSRQTPVKNSCGKAVMMVMMN